MGARQFRNGIALSVGALFCVVTSARAAEREADESESRSPRVSLDEVVVSGSREATALSETPVAIGVINQAALDRDKPKTMGDVLNRIAGVSWNDLGNEQHSMGIRQPNSTNSVYQYLEDGIPIRPLGVFNHNSLNELNLSGSETVEVVKGPASSLYGSNAVGGAVNFLTAKPSTDTTISVGARRDGVNGFERYDSALSDSFGDFGFRIGHYSSRRDQNNWQEYSYGEKDNLTARGDYALTGTMALRATFVYTNLDSAMTGSVFENDYRNSAGKSINTFTYRRDKTLRANLAWEFVPFDGGKATLTGFWRKNDHGQTPSYTIRNCDNDPNPAPGQVGSGVCGTINNNHVDSLGLDAKHVQEFDWWTARLIGGAYLDASDNPYVSDNLVVTRDPVTGRNLSYIVDNARIANGVRDYQTDILNYAPFFQLELSPFDAVRVVIGGRYDAIDYEFTNNLNGASVGNASTGAPNEVRHFSHFSPKLGATYSFARGISAYVNASEGFTAPEVSQLYGQTGIPDLRPATYRNYEVGIRLAFLEGALKFDSAVYRLEGEDTIVSYTIAPGSNENRNAGRTRSQGVEFGATFDSERVDARLGLATASHKFVEYRVSSALDYSGNKMPQAPSLITAEVGIRPVRGLRVAVEGIRQGAYWMNNANTVEYDGHTLLNVRGMYDLKVWGQDWSLWLQGRNLTNELYSDSASSSYSGVGAYAPNTQNQYTPGAPRSVMIGFTYKFEAK